MTTIVTRAGKGSPLTHTEVDTNFTNLNTNKLETAAIPLGTAAAPSVSFLSDANTGIYSPGADQVAVATNGTQKLIVLSNGNVGIGTSAPGATCEIYSSSSRRMRVGETPLYTPADFATLGGSLTLSRANDNRTDVHAIYGYDTAASAFNNLAITSRNQIIFMGNGSERMRIDDSGRLGIGTTSPAYALDVASSVAQVGNSTDAFIQYKSTAGNWHVGANSSNAYVFYSGTYGSGNERARIDSSGRLLVGTSDGSGGVSKLVVQGASNGSAVGVAQISYNGLSSAVLAANTDIGYLRFTDQGSNSGVFAQITASSDGTTGASDYPGRLVFSTTADGGSSPTERMRIDSSGYVSINATQNFPGDGNTGTGIFFERAADGGTIFGSRAGGKSGSFNRNEDGEVVRFNRSGVDVGSIDVTTSATSYNTSSDYRLKENIVLLTGATDRLNQLQVHRFNFIADSGATVDGFIAHEAQAVVPECVTGTKDEVDEDGNPVYQGIDQSKLVPLVTAALQEAIAKIETLEARLTAAGIE